MKLDRIDFEMRSQSQDVSKLIARCVAVSYSANTEANNFRYRWQFRLIRQCVDRLSKIIRMFYLRYEVGDLPANLSESIT